MALRYARNNQSEKTILCKKIFSSVILLRYKRNYFWMLYCQVFKWVVFFEKETKCLHPLGTSRKFEITPYTNDLYLKETVYTFIKKPILYAYEGSFGYEQGAVQMSFLYYLLVNDLTLFFFYLKTMLI